MDKDVLNLQEVAYRLGVGAGKVRQLIEENGLPVVPVLGDGEYHIFVPALMAWLWEHTMSGGQVWQGSADTNTAPAVFPNVLTDAGKPYSLTRPEAASGNGFTERRGGRQSKR